MCLQNVTPCPVISLATLLNSLQSLHTQKEEGTCRRNRENYTEGLLCVGIALPHTYDSWLLLTPLDRWQSRLSRALVKLWADNLGEVSTVLARLCGKPRSTSGLLHLTQ